jgi:uncharacterized membrane protein YkoI
MKTTIFFSVALLSIGTLFAEDDGKLVIDIPSSVQATIAKEKGETGKVRNFRHVNEADGTTYIVGLLLDGKNYEMFLDASGRVMRKRLDEENSGPKVMKIDAVPAKVRQILQREAGAGVIEQVELNDQKPTYITEVKIGKRKYRIEVDAEGTLLNKEHSGDDE